MDHSKALDIYRTQIERYIALNDEEWTAFKDHLCIRTLKKKQNFAEPEFFC